MSQLATAEHNTLHHALSEAWEAGIANRDWYLWLDPSGPDGHSDFDPLVAAAQNWLGEKDPDAAEQGEPLVWEEPGLYVEIRAIPKKKRARGTEPLVGNPYPAFAYWVT